MENQASYMAGYLLFGVLGHRNLQTTINYLNISNEELVEASEELFRQNAALYMADKLLYLCQDGGARESTDFRFYTGKRQAWHK